MLKKRFLTAIFVPIGQETSFVPLFSEADICTSTPASWSGVRVRRVTSATAAIDARASPLKPKVRM